MKVSIPLKVKAGTYWSGSHCTGKYGTVTWPQKEALIQNIFMLLSAK